MINSFFFRLRLKKYVREAMKARDEQWVFHIGDHSNAMYTGWLGEVAHIVTCHDVMAIQSAQGLIPGRKTGWTGRILQRWILNGLKRAQNVVCVSEETRKDLLSLAPELENRSVSIENALAYPYAPMSAEEVKRHLSELRLVEITNPEIPAFVLHVGGTNGTRIGKR